MLINNANKLNKVESMQSKLRSNRRAMEEKEDEITELKNKNRKITREIDELYEQNEALTREIANLRKTLQR